MKLQGKTLKDPNVEICVIPRGNGDDIVFKAIAVLDMTPFEKMCPKPKPPKKILKGGKKVEDYEAPAYQANLSRYASKRVAYMILKSLQATDGLEWDTVDLSDPNTWHNYDAELRDSGFSEIEIMRIVNTVMNANCLNEDKLEEARQHFLAFQQAQCEELSSQADEQETIPSGEPANDSE